MVQVQKLDFWYDKSKPILKDISLQFEKGNIYGVLGANGVGKTTLLRLLCGLVFPKSGQIQTNEHLPSSRAESFLRQLFYVPTEVELPKLKVEAYGELTRAFYPNFNKNTWDSLLEKFKIDKLVKTNALSFGQKKKVMLSFALASGCPVLIFDEPTDGLDIPARDVFRKELATLISEDNLAIITTHHVKDVEFLLSHLIILEDDSILLDTSLIDLTERLYTTRVRQLLGNGNVVYSERVAEGYHCLIKNEDGHEGQFDIELFYKAVAQNSSFLNSL